MHEQHPHPSQINTLVERFLCEHFHLNAPLVWQKVKESGSDRVFFRIHNGTHSFMVIVSSPISNNIRQMNNAYYAIGRHLFKKGIRVPEIYFYAEGLGLFIVEDLGDRTLKHAVDECKNTSEKLNLYQNILEILLDMQLRAASEFNTKMCYRASCYDENFMFAMECRYFLREYANNNPETLSTELWNFSQFTAHLCAPRFFLHRDFQSTNIMLLDEVVGIVDFQDAKIGPLQYDLASLLFDAYVDLDALMRETLLQTYIDKCKMYIHIDDNIFKTGFDCIAVHRLLQMLAAFSFLATKKGKKEFFAYIPITTRKLHTILHSGELRNHLPLLTKKVDTMQKVTFHG